MNAVLRVAAASSIAAAFAAACSSETGGSSAPSNEATEPSQSATPDPMAGAAGDAGLLDATTNRDASAMAASAPPDDASAAQCGPNVNLSGASYDITKSRFAFGAPVGAPVVSGPTDGGIDASSLSYFGPNGEVFIESNGVESAATRADVNDDQDAAAALDLPDWSTDPIALQAHAIAYWEPMGVQGCQLTAINQPGSRVNLQGNGLSRGKYITLDRSIRGVPLPDSKLSAHFNARDNTTSEDFYWPEIPADAVTTALAFSDTLGSPAGLAAYQAKLPANARGPGKVVLHHSTEGGIDTPFRALVTYDVIGSAEGDAGGGQSLSFGTDGKLALLPD